MEFIMYISGQRESGRRRSGDIKIPEKYAGTALADAKSTYETDADALRTAEEAFRRGYVFEETKMPTEEASEVLAEETQGPVSESPDASETALYASAEPQAVPAALHKNILPQRRGGLAGILDRLTSENIILIALILVLWDSKADDELLLMLVILFLC